MAPIAESLYFPSLDKCLNGDHHLLSWGTAYQALSGSTDLDQLANLRDALTPFLQDEDALKALSRPLSPFSPPTQASKSGFETQTAPINATPSGNGQYDIGQIKQDTLWLSDKAKIEERAALRIVVMEWQSRYQDTKSLVNGPEGSAGSNTNANTDQSSASDRSQIARRSRQTSLYFSETLSILQTGECLLRTWLARDLQMYPSWMLQIGERLAQVQEKDNSEAGEIPTSMKANLEVLRSEIRNYSEGKEWPFSENDEITKSEVAQVVFAKIVHALHLLFTQITYETKLLASRDVINWFKFCSEVSFFSNYNAADVLDERLFARLQLLVAMISLSTLTLPLALNSLPTRLSDGVNNDESRYLFDASCLSELQEVMTNAAELGIETAVQSIFAWSVLAQRVRELAEAYRAQRDEIIDQEDDETSQRFSAGAPLPITVFEKAYDQIRASSEHEDPISKLASWSVSENRLFNQIVYSARLAREEFGTTISSSTEFHIRFALWELLREVLQNVVYHAEAVEATLAVMNAKESYWDLIDSNQPLRVSIVDKFASDREVFLPLVLSQARQRYPFETTPLLQLCQALCRCSSSDRDGLPHVIQFMHFMNSFTQTMPLDFASYELREESNMNGVRLTSPLALFSMHRSRRQKQSRGLDVTPAWLVDVDEEWMIPEGTNGDILRDEKPFLACWDYEHSPLEYLATLLSTTVVSSGRAEFATQKCASWDETTEIIALFASLLTSCNRNSEKDGKQPSSSDAARKLLEEINKELAPNQDLISVICAIFEQELERKSTGIDSDSSTSLLVSCVQFLHALVPIQPGRVWSFLSRSQLLQVEQRSGNLAAVVVTNEIVTGHFNFLSACIRLFASLVEDAIASSVAKKGMSKGVTRFETQSSAIFVSDKIITGVVSAFVHILVGVSENSPFWRFQDQEESVQIRCMLLSIFERIIVTTFGYDDQTSPESKLSATLSSAATYLADVFLTPSESSGPINLILQMLDSGVAAGAQQINSKRSEYLLRQTNLALSFSATILKLGIFLDRPNSFLETKLFKSASGLVQLFIAQTTSRRAIVLLLKGLVESAGRVDGEPPSLLGHLGPDTARSFLSALNALDKPLCDPDMESDIWNLLSSIISNRQQWVSIYLLTGNTPKQSLSLGTKDEKKSHSKPLLGMALDKLSKLSTVPSTVGVATLKFISGALNHWPWVINDLRKHAHFITGISDYVSNVQWDDNCPYSKQEEKTTEYEITTLVVEILAVYLHESRQLGDYSRATDLFVKLSMLRQYGVSAPLYNSSLHSNLRQNIEKKFPGCTVQNFKRTPLTASRFGKDFFYDTKFTENVLKFHQSWSRSQGFLEEFVRANINLSFVESQILLTKSWKILAVEISNYCSSDRQWLGALAKTAGDCLDSNIKTNSGEKLFDDLKFVRTELAFVITQKVVAAKFIDDTTKSMYLVVWNAILESEQDFEIAFGDSNADYYRSLLRILFLSIQLCAVELGKDAADEELSQSVVLKALKNPPKMVLCLHEILTKAVGRGFRSLATQLHEDQSKCSPSDFALVTALLQSILRVPGMDLYHQRISLDLAGDGLVRCATSLFSWSDQLAIDRDPVYGELSILFLLELSSIGSMSETLAVEGVLSQLSAANIVNYYRRPNGMGPFDEPDRMYLIWARGFLPLCLNLLDAVGPPVAGEVASFLNQFPNQLSRSSDGLISSRAFSSATRSSGRITLSVAEETHSLAIIWLVLERYRQQGPGVTGVTAEIPELAWDHTGVKEDVDSWLKSSGALRDSMVTTNDREVEMARAKPLRGGGRAQSRLEERIISELEGALMCLETVSVQ